MGRREKVKGTLHIQWSRNGLLEKAKAHQLDLDAHHSKGGSAIQDY